MISRGYRYGDGVRALGSRLDSDLALADACDGADVPIIASQIGGLGKCFAPDAGGADVIVALRTLVSLHSNASRAGSAWAATFTNRRAEPCELRGEKDALHDIRCACGARRYSFTRQRGAC